MRRREIYYIENDNSAGCEQRGRRPAVIVGNDVGMEEPWQDERNMTIRR